MEKAKTATSRRGRTTIVNERKGAVSIRGFTLLEMVVVLTLIVAATVLVAPSFRNGLRSLELETATRDLITRMKMARSEAVSKQQVFRILFSESTQEDEQAEYSLTDDYEAPLHTFRLPVGVTVQAGPDQPPGETLKVSFYPNGRSSGGSLDLTNSAGRTLHVEVDPVTGLARANRPEDQP